MQLIKEQIESLFAFVEKKGVKYYDVQHEIVDHLATSIESEMLNNQNLSFEQSLSLVYSKFPITGFAQYTLKLEESINTFWLKKIFETITRGYGIPIIGSLVILTWSMYYAIESNGTFALNTSYYIIIVLGLLALFTFGRQFGRSGVNMMLYYSFIISKDDLNDRLLYYRVLKMLTLTIIFVPLFLSRMIYVVMMDQNFEQLNGLSYSLLLLSILSSISICWSLSVILYFPGMIKDVIAQKYNHVIIA